MAQRKLRILGILLVLSTLPLILSACQTGTELAGVRVAIVVSPKYFPDSVNLTSAALKRKGATVVLVGAETGLVNYFNGKCQSLLIEQAIKDISVDDFDAIYVTDATPLGHADTPLKETYVYDFLRAFAAKGKLVAGVDRGASLLMEAGVLSGKSIAAGVAPEEVATGHGALLAQGSIAEDGMVLTATRESIRDFNKTFIRILAGL